MASSSSLVTEASDASRSANVAFEAVWAKDRADSSFTLASRSSNNLACSALMAFSSAVRAPRSAVEPDDDAVLAVPLAAPLAAPSVAPPNRLMSVDVDALAPDVLRHVKR